MNRIFLRWGVVLAMLWICVAAQAQTPTCSLNISSLTTVDAVDPFNASAKDTIGTLDATCTRPSGGANRFPDPFLIYADNGANFDGSTRRLRVGATSNYIPYYLYTASNCVTPWASTDASAVSIANANQANGDVTKTITASFCFRIPGSQTLAAPGNYTDTVNLQIRGTRNNSNYIWTPTALPFTLNTSVNAACSFTTPASDMVINYTAFAASDVPASPSNFGLRCTNTTAYLVALNSYSGTLLGVNYTLALSSGIGTGSGLEQILQVTGSAASGQAGVCAVGPCTDFANHTITVTY